MTNETITIRSVRPPSPREWDEAWDGCDYATYFHSREWLELWQAYSGGRLRAAPRLVSFSDGAKAVLPLSCESRCRGLLKAYVSSPAGTFGGWISNDALSVRHAELLVQYMLNRVGELTWRVSPYDDNVFKVGVQRTDEETHALNLARGFEAAVKKFSKGNRWSVGKARRHGILVRPAAGPGDWSEYFEVYQDSLSRWGERATSNYAWTLFEELHRLRSPKVRLWLAVHREKIVAGALCFYARRHAVYWHGATLKDSFEHSPVNLLLHDVIRDASERGLAWFDFNPSGGHEGVKKFKLSFGAEPLSSPVVRTYSMKNALYERVLRYVKGSNR